MAAENDNPERKPPSRFGQLLRRADQAAIAAVALVAIVLIGGYWLVQAKIRHRVIDLDTTPPRVAVFQVDLNKADWPELLQVPDMGETLARAVVAWRAAHGPFRDIGDLRKVKGIGVKKFAAMKPFLKPITAPPTEAAAYR
jgi:competence protein ComEA